MKLALALLAAPLLALSLAACGTTDNTVRPGDTQYHDCVAQASVQTEQDRAGQYSEIQQCNALPAPYTLPNGQTTPSADSANDHKGLTPIFGPTEAPVMPPFTAPTPAPGVTVSPTHDTTPPVETPDPAPKTCTITDVSTHKQVTLDPGSKAIVGTNTLEVCGSDGKMHTTTSDGSTVLPG